MAVEALVEQNKILQGFYDDSAYLSIDNTAAPGLLVRAGIAGREFRITDIIAYNTAVGVAVVTLYDQGSNVLTVFAVGAGETAVIELKSSIRCGLLAIHARTDQAANTELTITGKWRLIGR